MRLSPESDEKSNQRDTRKARHRYERPMSIQASPRMSRTKMMTNMLNLHNYYRAQHSAPPLTISRRLNQIAQAYADQLAATSRFEHSGNRLYNEILGENLYMEWISHGPVPVSTRTAMKSWYDEIGLYDFNNPGYSEETGHFTQMVWRSTKWLGVGMALSADGREVYFVTNYYPAGNIVNYGYFQQNVLPPTGGA